jgi:hypothetical protein
VNHYQFSDSILGAKQFIQVALLSFRQGPAPTDCIALGGNRLKHCRSKTESAWIAQNVLSERENVFYLRDHEKFFLICESALIP